MGFPVTVRPRPGHLGPFFGSILANGRNLEPASRHEIDLPKSTTLLGEWTANLVVIRRQHLVLAANNATLLPVVLSSWRSSRNSTRGL